MRAWRTAGKPIDVLRQWTLRQLGRAMRESKRAPAVLDGSNEADPPREASYQTEERRNHWACFTLGVRCLHPLLRPRMYKAQPAPGIGLTLQRDNEICNMALTDAEA